MRKATDGLSSEGTLPVDLVVGQVLTAWRVLDSRTDASEMLPAVLRLLVDLCDGHFGYLFLTEPEQDIAFLCGVYNLPEPAEDVLLQRSDLERVRQAGEVVFLNGSVPGMQNVCATIRALDGRICGETTAAGGRNCGLLLNLTSRDQYAGFIAVGREDGRFPGGRSGLLAGLAERAAAAILSCRELRPEREGDEGLYRVMAQVIDATAGAAEGHSLSVAECAEMTARQMGLSRERCFNLRRAGYVHDFGKLFAPKDLREKPGLYSQEELQRVRKAVLDSTELLGKVQSFAPVLPILRHLTECYDGTGYPDGLRGNAIPLESRILAVAHRFYVLLEARPYRRHLGVVSDAMSRMRERAGKDFDPQVVESFFQALGGPPMGMEE